MSKNLVIVPVVAFLAIGFGVYEHQRVRQAEEATHAVARERDELRTQLREAQSWIAATGSASDDRAFSEKSAAASRPSAASSEAERKAVERLAREADIQMAIQTMARQNMQAFDVQYRPLYRLAQFTPAQVEQFKSLLEKSNRRRAELVRAVDSRNAPKLAEALEAIEDQLAAEFTVDARAIFDDAAAQKIERYRETEPLRIVTERLASNLFYTETPLTAAQAEQLIPILARHARGSDGAVGIASLNVEAALPEAQAVLSPGQLGELREISNQYAARNRKRRELEERSAANAARGAQRK
ncbi:MAG: hypothetical protein ABIZ49_05925 [Opitutaceae bacterium]